MKMMNLLNRKKIAVEVRRLSQTISVNGKQSVPEKLAQ
jgi:hypothetical protein